MRMATGGAHCWKITSLNVLYSSPALILRRLN
jgi:hypothetical protein